MILTLILVFLLTLILGFPVAFCLGITSLAALVISDVPLVLMAQRMFTGIDSFPLMAVPFFVLAGELMNRGGTTKRLIDFANVLVGRVPGGLAHTNILASMFFGGISGSAVADAAAMGTVLLWHDLEARFGADAFPQLLAGAVAVIVASTLVATLVPLRLGLRHLENLEI